MSIYYVDPAGDDNDTGGVGDPWETLAKANATVAAGDTVNINDGTYAENVTITTGGTAGNVITWQATNSRLANVQRFICIDKPYLTFDGLRFLGDGTSTSTSAQLRIKGDAAATNNITVNDCGFFGALRRAVNVVLDGDGATLASYPDTIIVQNSLFDQCHGCVSIQAQNFSVLNNEMRDMRDSGASGDVNYVTVHGDGGLVKGNYMHSTDTANTGGKHVDCIQSFNSGNPKLCNDMTIEENLMGVPHQCILMQNLLTSPANIMGNITVQNNIIYDYSSGANHPQGVVLEGIANIDVNHNTFLWGTGSSRFCFGFRANTGESTTGNCDNNVQHGGKMYSGSGSGSVVNDNNLSSNGVNAESTDYLSGAATDPVLIDNEFPWNPLDSQGTFTDADAGWRPDTGSPCLGNASDAGTDIGAEIAVDSGGLPADTTPPVITLVGAAEINIPDTDVTYTDAGATCVDDVDGELTMTAGVHDTDGVTANLGTPGTYTYDWDRDDAAANSATQVTRTVNIIATPPTPITRYLVTVQLA